MRESWIASLINSWVAKVRPADQKVRPADQFNPPLATACLSVTCLRQQHLAANSAIKVYTKWFDFIVIIVLPYI